ncbi:hypothetical protein [Gemmata massiliana]|nr:hypothetical protein [Gemmata massiliana]
MSPFVGSPVWLSDYLNAPTFSSERARCEVKFVGTVIAREIGKSRS